MVCRDTFLLRRIAKSETGTQRTAMTEGKHDCSKLRNDVGQGVRIMDKSCICKKYLNLHQMACTEIGTEMRTHSVERMNTILVAPDSQLDASQLQEHNHENQNTRSRGDHKSFSKLQQTVKGLISWGGKSLE